MAELKGTVLFVENYADTRALVAYILEGAGYQVTNSDTMREALELADAQHFDLFLLNHILPDGSGITLCHQLHLAHSGTPIVMFSAAAHPAERDAGLEAGADEYLVKPADLFNIPMVIEHLIEGRETEQSGLKRLILSQETFIESDAHFTQVAHQFAELFRGLPVACFLFDQQGRIVEWNHACELLYGRCAQDVFLQPVIGTVICPTDEGAVEALVARVLSGEAVEGLEMSVQNADGRRRDVLSNSFPPALSAG